MKKFETIGTFITFSLHILYRILLYQEVIVMSKSQSVKISNQDVKKSVPAEQTLLLKIAEILYQEHLLTLEEQLRFIQYLRKEC